MKVRQKILVKDAVGVKEMFRELARKKKQLSMEECLLFKEEIEKYARRTLLLELIPEHICGKLVTES